MKNNKKIFNYLLVLCASFIISLCYVNAAAINKVPLNPGETLSFGDKYNFTSCDNPDPSHFNITGEGSNWKIEYHTASEGLEIFEYSCNGYKLGEKKENKNWNYTINVSGKTIITDENGVIERTISVNAGQKTTLDGYCQGRNNCKIEIIDNASGTLSVDGTIIKINRSNITTSVQGKALLTYEEKGVTNKITLEIVVPDEFGGAVIYPGDTNLCRIDTSVWKAKDWVDSSGHHHPYYQAKGDATFPTCSGEKSVYPLEFKGWVPTEPNKNITNLNESCSGMVSGTTADSTGSYFACYEAKPTIQIAVEANVSNPQDWQKVTGMGYYYVGSNTKEVQLPELSFIGFNKKKELDYWESDKGEHKQSGDSVPLDGSVWKAVIKTSSTIDIRGFERNIYIGKVAVFSSVTDVITSCSSGSPGIVEAKMVSGECQVTGLQETDGEYSAKVFATTDKGETINYNVKVSGYTGGQNGNVAFEVNTDDNVNFEVVKQPSKEVTEDKNGDSTSFSKGTSTLKTTCTRFQFSYNIIPTNSLFEPDYFHISNRVGNSIKFHAFCVPDNGKFNVDGNGKPTSEYPEYDALCLEEHQAPPNYDGWDTNVNPIYGVEYTLDSLGNSHLKFVLDYIVKNYYYDSNGNPTNALKNGKDYRFVTAQILTRLAWIQDGKASTTFMINEDQIYWHGSYAEVAPVFFDTSVEVGSARWNEEVIGHDGELAPGENAYGIAIKNGNRLAGSGLGVTNSAIIAELEKVHKEWINAGGKAGLDKYLNTMSGEGFVGNDVPEKNSAGEKNPSYETNKTNTYSLTYEGSILTTEMFKNRKITLEPACDWAGVVCEVVQQPTYSGDTDSDGNLMFKYKVRLRVTDAANVQVPKTPEDKDKVSFKVLVDGKNVSFSDAFILHAENGGQGAGQYQRMLVFNPDASEAEAKLYFPFLLIPSRCIDVPATNFENYGKPEFNQELFVASDCCKDITNDVENQELLQQVCQGKCTTSTFTNVCRWDTKFETDAELYLIKEGTKYDKGEYKNQIGACIADVEHDYSIKAQKAFFMKTDDNGNSINIDKYEKNRYCQVTCKEDWSISMDSFGNYVGVKAIAAGTSFAINNDMFISGERTCYTSYVNTDLYMDEMTDLSEKIVKEYNKYSNNAHAYTDILNSNSPSEVKKIDHLGVCVEWEKCPSGYEPSGTSCVRTDTAKDDVSSQKTGCEGGSWELKEGKGWVCTGTEYYYYTHNFTCSDETLSGAYDGITVSGTPETTSEDSRSSSPISKTCTYTTEVVCKDTGNYYDYELKTNKRFEGGNYKRYTVQTTEKDTDPFGHNVDLKNKGIEASASYERTEKFTCEYHANKKPEGLASLTCTYSTESAAPSDDDSRPIDGEVQKAICGDTKKNNEVFCTSPSTTKAHKALQEKSLEKTNLAAQDAAQKMGVYYSTVYEYTHDLYSCQNFYLFNTDTLGSRPDELKIPQYTSLGTDNLIKIDTDFNPTASYKYDEAAFMTLLGADNVIEEFTKKNSEVASSGGANWEKDNGISVDAQVIAYDKYGKEYGVSDVQLQKNNKTTTYYYDKPWPKNTKAYDNYDSNTNVMSDSDYELKAITFCTAGTGYDKYVTMGSRTDNYQGMFVGVTPEQSKLDWAGGQCYTAYVKYRKAHYIKSSIGNSSYYQNKGNWYMNTVNDIKEHGDNLEGAIQNANARSSGLRYKTDENSKSQWTLINGTTQNVFPVSLTTPRNLYQYTYAFKNIGYFNDNKKLGRIMGDQDSIIASNVRTCFYEIYEDVCLCCGSKITTHVDDESYVDADLLSKIEKIGGGSGNYTYNNSNADVLKTGGSGTLKIVPSTISLGDVASQYGNSSATIPTNWSDKSPFIYNGAKYYTDKGSVALKQIEEQGEHIYADTAEYSYYLTPDTLAAIREYNDVNGYEINANNLRVVTDSGIYGYAIDASKGTKGAISSSDGNREDYVIFQHYGSKFLENEMWSYNAVLSNTLAQTKNNKICYVEGKADINSKVKEGCRWVDYIQSNNKVDENDKRNEDVPFRLAFK